MPAPRCFDLSHPLGAETPPWPGNPPTTVQVLDAIPADRVAGETGTPGEPGYLNATCFSTCNHTGTHMDAPAHFCGDGRTIDEVPLDQCVGRCTLLRLPPCEAGRVLGPGDFEPVEASLVSTRRLVVDTGWARHWHEPAVYFSGFPTVDEAGARWLVERGLVLFGFDSPSLDDEPHPAHRVVLGAGAVIVENLTNLHAVPGPEFELVVAPLALAGLEASPVRALALA